MFSQTLQSLAAERRRRWLVGLAVSLALLTAWAVWFFGAKVAVAMASDKARLEVEFGAHVIDAPVAARITTSRLVVGLPVARGDVLVELDRESEERRLREA